MSDATGSTSADAGSATTGLDATTAPLATTTGATADTSPDSSGASSTTGAPELSDCERLLDAVDAIEASTDVDEEAFVLAELRREVQYGPTGVPLVETDRTCFFHLGDPGASISVAGDFNDWDPDATPLVAATTDLGFHWAAVDLPASDATGLYKLVRDGREFIADPLARRFGWDAFGEYSQLAPDPARSHHERWPDFDAQVGALAPRALTVYVPAGGLDRSDLPVIYMHDGQNLFDPQAFFGGWQVTATMDALIGSGAIPPALVVGIANTPDRLDEYTHVQDDVTGMVVGGRADEYADFVVGGVLPFVAARYPVDPSREATAVVGSSLGGLVSLYLGWRHPDVFGWAGSMSGSLFWGASLGEPTMLDLYMDMPPVGVSLYVDSGGGPGMGCPGGGSDNYCDNVEFADGLRALGWQDELDLVYRWDPDAPHNEGAWAARLPELLTAWRFAGG